MSKSYKEAMDKIKMSDELKEKIINASAKGDRKRKLFKPAYIVAATTGLAACLALVFALNASDIKKTDRIGQPGMEIAQTSGAVPRKELATTEATRTEPEAADAAADEEDTGADEVHEAKPASGSKAKPAASGSAPAAKTEGDAGKTQQQPIQNEAGAEPEPGQQPETEQQPERMEIAMAKIAQPADEAAEPSADATATTAGETDDRLAIASADTAAAATAVSPKDGSSAGVSSAGSSSAGGSRRGGGGGGGALKPTEEPTEETEQE